MERDIEIDGLPIKVLRVPYFSQSSADWLCFVYSIKMVLDFYKNIHENGEIRRASPQVDRDNLMKITNTRPNVGTPLSQDLIVRLNAAFPTMEFELKKTSYDEVNNEIKEHHPVIVLYNPSYLLINERGPGHAAVVVGMTENYIVLNNPWGGPCYCIEKNAFDNSWELEYNLAIFIKPKQNKQLF